MPSQRSNVRDTKNCTTRSTATGKNRKGNHRTKSRRHSSPKMIISEHGKPEMLRKARV